MEKFMIGTKFYRIGESGIPEIIRLKKQEENVLYFNTGGYNVYLTQDEKKKMHDALELKPNGGKNFSRFINFFGNWIEQAWTMMSDTEDGDYVKFKVENIGVSMTVQELKDNYIKLVPDAFMTISNITYPINDEKETGFDVMVTLNRFEENVPEVICRQDSVDIFRFSNSQLAIPIGISIPKIACPQNMNYLDFLYSKECKNFKSTAVYLDDSLDTVLKYFGSLNKYDNTMRKLKEKYKNTRMMGCNSSVRELLIKTGFYADFQTVFGTYNFPFSIDTSRSEFNASELRLLNSVINNSNNKVITEAHYCPYDRGINIEELETKHVLINTGDPKESDVFLVAYIESEIN